MRLVDIELIEGIFDADRKRRMIADATDAMVRIEGEALRGTTRVRIPEIAGGEWAIVGWPLSATDFTALRPEPA